MFKFPESAPKTDAKYDVLKFLLSLLVLAIHSKLYPMVLYPWLRIAVPLFFVMSSYFVFSKIQEASANQHKKILKQFVIRNLQLYFFWLVILLPITLLIRKDVWFSGSFIDNTIKILQSLFFSSTFVASWFIPATIIGVLIIYFLGRIFKHNFILLFIGLVAFCIVTLASSYGSELRGTPLATAINYYITIFGGLVCSFPAAIFWVLIGKFFAEGKIRIKSMALLIGLIVCSAVLLFIEWRWVFSLNGSYNNDSYFMLAPLCVLLFAAIQKITPFFWKHSVLLKRASTIIYVTHGSILPIFTKLLYVFFHIRSAVLSFLLTGMCCLAVYLFIEFIIASIKGQRLRKLMKSLY